MNGTTRWMPLNLQFFAQGSGETPDAPEGAAEKPEGEAEAAADPQDLNTLLATNKRLQSQFDQLVTKSLTTARAKWEREQGMTAQELALEKDREREEALALREQALAQRELRAQALATLGERELPAALIDCVALTGQEAMGQSIDKAEKAFRAAVEWAVTQRVRGAAPKSSGGQEAHAAQIRQAMGLK